MKAIADAGRAGPLRTEIANNRQPYFDEPVYVEVSRAKLLALAVNAALVSLRPRERPAPRHVVAAVNALYDGSADARQQEIALRWLLRGVGSTEPRGPVITASIRVLSHYRRVLLQWLKPDGKGGFVPKYERDGASA